jgi:hypothetical protein
MVLVAIAVAGLAYLLVAKPQRVLPETAGSAGAAIVRQRGGS